jgi:dihydroorotate dehydrogenase
MKTARHLFWDIGTATMRCLPPELAHDIGITCLKNGIAPRTPAHTLQENILQMEVDLGVEIAGLGKISHPIGLAAGFDKDAECIVGCERVGFSFVEVGTVTPFAQPGNPRPRIWRQKREKALINAMGFNNNGIDSACRRVNIAHQSGIKIPVGVNIGKNKATPAQNALDDYAKGFQKAREVGNFFIVNISSPNTPGLRDLATPQFVRDLATTCESEQKSRTWIKLSPDMERHELQALIEAISLSNFAGVVLSNTHKVDTPHPGGQSGKPIFELANSVLQWSWDVHRGALPTLASGGVFSGADAFEKIARGASAVEIFTAFIYRGPMAVELICHELALEFKKRGLKNLAEAKGLFFRS